MVQCIAEESPFFRTTSDLTTSIYCLLDFNGNFLKQSNVIKCVVNRDYAKKERVISIAKTAQCENYVDFTDLINLWKHEFVVPHLPTCPVLRPVCPIFRPNAGWKLGHRS